MGTILDGLKEYMDRDILKGESETFEQQKEEAKQLEQDFSNLKDDVERWKWVKEHQPTDIIINLDSDETFGTIKLGDGFYDTHYFVFDDSLGDSDGALNLLKAMNIKCVKI